MKVRQQRESVSASRLSATLASVGVCTYLAGFVMPVNGPWDLDIPLIILAGCATLSALYQTSGTSASNVPLLLPVAVFLATTAISIGGSTDPARSLRLSAALLPGILLFFVITQQFQEPRHLLWLCVIQSAVGLGISLTILHALWRKHWVVPPGYVNWISETGSPILIATNDAAYLAVLAPLSLVALTQARGRAIPFLAGASLASTLAALVLIQSRIAILALLISTITAGTLLFPKRAGISGLAIMAAAIGIDGLRGFPLLAKFSLLTHAGAGVLWDARIPIWSAAWAMFKEHPWFGQGPHTFSYTSPDGINVGWAHSLYLEVLAEQGVVGLITFVWLIGATAYTGVGVLRDGAGERRTLGAGVISALAGLAAACLFDFSFARQWVAVSLFTIVGITAQLGKQKNQEANTE